MADIKLCLFALPGVRAKNAAALTKLQRLSETAGQLVQKVFVERCLATVTLSCNATAEVKGTLRHANEKSLVHDPTIPA